MRLWSLVMSQAATEERIEPESASSRTAANASGLESMVVMQAVSLVGARVGRRPSVDNSARTLLVGPSAVGNPQTGCRRGHGPKRTSTSTVIAANSSVM